MRYELTDHEWFAIKPLLPNKPRGVPRVDDRRVLNGIFWVLRSGAPWRDLPRRLRPYTTSYNRFVGATCAGLLPTPVVCCATATHKLGWVARANWKPGWMRLGTSTRRRGNEAILTSLV
jgi:transposase